jgi:hypothetical protein
MKLRIFINNDPSPDLYELYAVSTVEGVIRKINDQLSYLKTQKKLQNVELKSVIAKTKSNSWFSSEPQDTEFINLTGPIPEIIEENGMIIVNAYLETMTGGRRRNTRKSRKNRKSRKRR